MFGSIFLLTQYLQFVMGYSALQAGVRLLPMAITMLFVAPSSARIVERVGTKAVVDDGLVPAGARVWRRSRCCRRSNISYSGDVMWRMIIMASGMGLVMAPATESIMGSLPRAKAGVGSAVNDTTRQVGGALGVAVIGSVMTSTYGPHVAAAFEQVGLPSRRGVARRPSRGLGFVVRSRRLEVPGTLRRRSSPARKDAFVTGMHRGVLVARGGRVPRCADRRDLAAGAGRERRSSSWARRARRPKLEAAPSEPQSEPRGGDCSHGRPAAQHRVRPGDPRRRARSSTRRAGSRA